MDIRTIDGYDVVVVGGGPGGVGAAAAAARGGAKTLLMEREGCLGGAGTTMLVNPFMRWTSTKGPNGEPSRTLNAGVFAEIMERLRDRGALRPPPQECRFDDESLKLVLDELVRDAGADVVFHAALYDAEVEDGAVKALRLAHNSGPLRVTGKVFVDSTGDGLLAAAAGCEILMGDEAGNVMPMTTFFAVANVDHDAFPEKAWIKKRIKTGAQDDPPLINTWLSTLGTPPNGLVYFNAIRVQGNPLDPFDLSRAEAEGRGRVENFVQWLRRNVPGCENAILMKTGSHIGVRETRRVVGDYTLTGDDVLSYRVFDDAIAYSSYPLDVHGQDNSDKGGVWRPLDPGCYYQIPFRCLIPRRTRNLLVGSRCVSADVVAHSSLRVMPVVTCIGQAAGTAAAMSLPEGDVRDVDVSALRQAIRDAGGVVE